MSKYLVTMKVRGIVEAWQEMKLWRHNFNLTDISNPEIIDVEDVEKVNPQTKLEKMCRGCDWKDYYCEECGECFDDCTCHDNIDEDEDFSEDKDDDDCIRCGLDPETCGCWGNHNNCDECLDKTSNEFDKEFVADTFCDGEVEQDLIFDDINDWLLRGHFSLCSYYLENLPIDKLPTSKLILILTATLPASTKLPARPRFYDRVCKVLQQRGENTITLLSGLQGFNFHKEPLPCPFCGGEVAPYQISTGQCYIQCYNDNCEVRPAINAPSESEEEVIRKWNKRQEKP